MVSKVLPIFDAWAAQTSLANCWSRYDMTENMIWYVVKLLIIYRPYRSIQYKHHQIIKHRSGRHGRNPEVIRVNHHKEESKQNFSVDMKIG